MAGLKWSLESLPCSALLPFPAALPLRFFSSTLTHFSGLEMKLGETPVALAVEGRSGIPHMGYEGEGGELASLAPLPPSGAGRQEKLMPPKRSSSAEKAEETKSQEERSDDGLAGVDFKPLGASSDEED